MTFDEEFNTFSNSPDGTSGTWMTAYPYGGLAARTLSGNKEAEYYSDSSVGVNPFSLSNGILTISATPGSNPANLPYNSGVITTDKSFSQTYGYFEVSAQLPVGQGLWPAFWMLPASNNYSSELDIFEVIGSIPNTVNATVHGMYGDQWDVSFQGFQVADTSQTFHTYGVDWEPGTTTYYFDGKALGSAVTPTSMNDPMFMILNLAVGGAGSWPGMPDAATVFPAELKIDYVRAYATANTNYVGGSAAIPAETSVPIPVVTTPVVPASSTTVTIGSGADTLALSISEDAWKGDAQFTISVDGKQVGGTQTAIAAKAKGTTQIFNVLGTFSAGQHTVGINFLNDDYGGTASTDRNLYVTSASLNGTAVPSSSLALTMTGAQSISFTKPVTTSANSDTLHIGISQDAFQGDAHYLISVDGTQVGGERTATAAHSSGATQDVSVAGNWGSGAHSVGITFINDAYGGTAATDRNLYVDSVSYDGRAAAQGAASLLSNGTRSFAVPGAPPAVPLPTLTLHMAEDAYAGDAAYSIAIDGKVSSTGTVAASNALGNSQPVNLTDTLSAGWHDLSISFLNDLYAGTAVTDRNLYVKGIDVQGKPATGATFNLTSTSTEHFWFLLP